MSKTTKIIAILITTLFLTACTMNNVNQDQTDNYGYDQNQSQPSTSSGNKSNLTRQPVLGASDLQNKTATLKTAKGDIVIELYGDVAPQTVSNFIQLSQSGFYNGLIFHRREEGFVIQGGDPKGNGTGGPGYTVPAEINDKSHVRGAVAMARLGDQANPTKASSGSQFYIVLDDALFLDGEYTLFGMVTSGMEVADMIQVGDVINSVEIK